MMERRRRSRAWRSAMSIEGEWAGFSEREVEEGRAWSSDEMGGVWYERETGL